ncbi:universal stress protein [Halorubrum sp. JWXQ-INN 858]|uniref:universal stress protein n=1 Tax=Halorubrum sp. JWXQ-INN 858 TaxID=2690782 RepID=UPI0013576EBC|nr:universal stress protein [Halorubrum sp. JWXQ-INN 858]MWV63346.1 universal stress protein [Halorubrum sp. JWXQ-INN 858]
MIERVLVPMDGSEAAERALRYALEVHDDAEIVVFHVSGEPSSMMGKAAGIALSDDADDSVHEDARGVIDRARAIAAEYGASIDVEVTVGQPAQRIVDRAEGGDGDGGGDGGHERGEGDGIDAVVLGTHGGSLVDRLMVGNVAESVVRRSPVPVTVVR